ncbi:hypothetical protein L7F22_059548 [Adiantum nelumboides]|nr:hypothetical protein [Adiantum nelumboides]
MAAHVDRSICQPYRRWLHLCTEVPATSPPAVADRSSSNSKPPLQRPSLLSSVAGTPSTSDLWQKLWTDPKSEELKAQALNTLFISGVGLGILDPRIFGKYTVQDAVYCAKIANLWLNVSKNPNADAYLQDLARALSKKYLEVATEMLQWWQIQTDGVWLGEHAREYEQMVEESVKENPAYMLVATFPCLKHSRAQTTKE